MKVITVHGIKRYNRWYEAFEELDDVKKNQIEVLNFDYGFFKFIDFLWESKREAIIDRFCAFYNDKMLNSAVIPSAIGHSFGTYVLYKAMERYDSIKFDRIIMCGTILNSRLDFRKFFENGQVKQIINDYGTREWFVGATRYIIDKDCGSAGKIGFKDIPPKFKTMFINKANVHRHSDYFLPLHMKQNWLPYIIKSKEKYDFNENILRRDVIKRIYDNITRIKCECAINEIRYYSRVDLDGNYYAKYEQYGINNAFNSLIDSIVFTTSADSMQDAIRMNLIAYDLNGNNKLSYDIQENITHHKTFKVHLSKPASFKEKIDTKFYFNLTSTINFTSGDVDHYVIKDVENVLISANYPRELKLPKIFEIKDNEVIGQKAIENRRELDGSITYFLKYKNHNNNDGLMLYFEGLLPQNNNYRRPKHIDFKLSQKRGANEYTLTEASSKDIRKIYNIENEIELQDSADENTLEQRRKMFNEGFLVIKSKKNSEVIGYLESILWNEKPFETFEEISNFPMHYNVEGDTLYIIFIAVSKNQRKKGFATKLIQEIENVAKKYKVKKMRLVAKDQLVAYYSKFGFRPLTEMPTFLKGKPYKSVLMEKPL